MTRIVELRIHGVSGTPPQDMLQRDVDHRLTEADLVQVAGDDQTAFYRVAADPTGGAEAHHIREAYSWGQLTSGSWTTSLWLVLVPFGLINAAHFMLPRTGNVFGSLCRIASEAMLRLLGLIATAVLTLATAEVLVDLIAWQWTGLHAKDSTIARYADPRGALLVGLLVSGLVPVLMFAFGGRRAPAAGEPVAPPSPANPLAPFTEMAGGPVANSLDSPASEFDVGDPDIPTLTRLHLGASGAVLGWIGFCVFGSGTGPTSGFWSWCHEYGTRTCAILLTVIVIAVVLIGNPHHDAGPVRRWIVRGLGLLGIVAGGLGWLVGAVAMLRLQQVPTMQRGVLPGVGRSTQVAMISGLAALTALLVTCALGAVAGKKLAPDGPFRRYLFGMTSPVLAAVGILLGVGFGAATVFGVRHLLLATVASGQDFALPPVYRRVAHAWGLTVGEILLIIACLLLIWWGQRKRFVEGVRRAHNVEPYLPGQPAPMTGSSGLRQPDDLTPSAIAGVAFAWWTARIKMHVQWIFCVLAVVGLLLTVLTVLAARHDTPTACADDGPPGWPVLGVLVSCDTFGGTAMVAVGSLALLGLFTGLVAIGRKSLKDSSTRRGLNVVWDIIAFWPRAAHPLVPPPYTAKGLDQLRRRIYYHLGMCPVPSSHQGAACHCARSPEPADRVVLAAHSQGSLLAVAAIAGLRLSATGGDESVRFDQLGLLTFGSQLQFAYSRGFPRYANVELLQALLALCATPDGGSRWINLLRETDPIGGQVLSDRRTMTQVPPRSFRLTTGGLVEGIDVVLPTGVRRCGPEWRLLDPVPTDGETKPRRDPLRHSGYFLDPAWELAVHEVSR